MLFGFKPGFCRTNFVKTKPEETYLYANTFGIFFKQGFFEFFIFLKAL